MASIFDFLAALNDASKAIGSGFVTGASQTAGIPGDMISKTADTVFGGSPNTRSLFYDTLPFGAGRLPTSQGAEQFIRDYVTGPAYQPQTAFGRGSQALGEMLPALALSGMAANAGNAAMAAGANTLPAFIMNGMAGTNTAMQGTRAAESAAADPRMANSAEALRQYLLGFGSVPRDTGYDTTEAWRRVLSGAFGGVRPAY